MKAACGLITEIEVVDVGATQAVAVLPIPVAAAGRTRAVDRIFAGRAVIVPLAEEMLAIGRLPVAIAREGVLVVRVNLVAASGLPTPLHAVQFLHEVTAGKRVQRDRSVNPEVLGEENVAMNEVRRGLRA